jgi:O-antigen/teichoic acid export membrane protein
VAQVETALQREKAARVNRSLSQRTIGNAGVLLAGAAVETVLQVAFLVLAGRQLGPSEFGFYGYLLAWVTFAAAVAHWGLPVIAVREMAQRPADETSIFAAVFRIRALWSVLLFVIAGVVASAVPLSADHRAAIWLTFAYLLGVPFDLSLLFDAHQRSRWDVPGRIAGRIVSVGLLALLWRIRGALTVADVALCSTLFLLVNGAVGWMVARRLGHRLRPFAPTPDIHRLLRVSAPVVWSSLMTLAYSQSQTILVKWLSTALETGFSALACRLLMPLLVFRGIVHRVLLPLISEVGQDRAALTARLERVFPALALLFMPLTALAIAVVQVLLVPLFGTDYAGAVLPLQITVAHFFFSGAGALIGMSLLVGGDARTPAVGLTVGCAGSLLLSVLLIPAWGAVGAACATLFGELIAVFYPLPRFLKILRPKVLPRVLRTAAVSLLGLALFCLVLRVPPFSGIAALTVELIVILVGLRLTGEISPERLQAVRALFRRESLR